MEPDKYEEYKRILWEEANAAWMIHPKRNEIISKIRIAKKKNDKRSLDLLDNIQRESIEHIYRGYMRELDKCIEVIDNVRACDDDKKKKIDVLCGVRLMLLDLIEAVNIDIESATKPFIKGQTNPFEEKRLSELAKEAKSTMNMYYGAMGIEFIGEFQKAVDDIYEIMKSKAEAVKRRADYKNSVNKKKASKV